MLKGTLDDFTLPDIFRLLSQSRKTGRLDVERSAGNGNIFFKEGNVYFAESTLSRELVGQKLVKAKVLTDGQLMKALDEQAEGGGRVGEVLLRSGLVTAEQLETALRGQIEDAVFDLLRWDAGEFDWAPGELVDAEISLSVSVENLIMEGSRRLDELAIITRKIPSENSLVEMAPAPPEGAAEINIRPDEWRMLVLVNGQRTVLDIAEAVGSDVFATMRTLYGLAAAGLVHVPGHVMEDEDEPLPSLAEEPVANEAVEEVAAAPELDAQEAETSFPDVLEMEVEDIVEPVAESEPAEEDVPVAASDSYHADAYTPDTSFEDADMSFQVGDDAERSGDRPEVPATVDATDLPTSEWFDAPEPGDIMAEDPVEAVTEEVGGTDPFASEILAPLETPDEAEDEPLAEIDNTSEPFADPASSNGHQPHEDNDFETDHDSGSDNDAEPFERTVDKSAAVRELSDLFKQTEVDSRPTFMVPETGKELEAPDEESRHRVEDDEEITRGLISRLIDGVKGL